MIKYEYVIVGAGIVGLTIARELLSNKKNTTILVIEKEDSIGFHASGRNSGVLHSGIYYSKETLKAKVCSTGARKMVDYCSDNSLPIKKIGKVIVATKKDDDITIGRLIQNAKDSNLNYKLIDKVELSAIEPCAKSATERALYLPDASIVDSKKVLISIVEELKKAGVIIKFNEKLIDVDREKAVVQTTNGEIKYGYLVNAAGQYADHVAHLFGVGGQYSILPFKGSYYRLREGSGIFSNGLIYPVPDLNRPFRGIHTVKDMMGKTYFGPTAVPVFGRENYYGFRGVNFTDATNILYRLSKMYYKNRQQFRNYVHHEALNNIKSRFTESAQKIVKGLIKEDLLVSQKKGIRPQLINKVTDELVMDLKIEETENTIHILNAISPAFTASFSFAELIANRILKNSTMAKGVSN